MIAAIDASGWAIIIAAVFLGFTQIVGMILAYFRERDKIVRDKVVAAKVEEVAVKQAVSTDKLEGIADIGRKAHELANSETLARKRKYAEKCEAMSSLTNKAEDRREAELSREEYLEHQRTHDAMALKELRETVVKLDRHEELKEKIEQVPAKVVEKLDEKG